MPHDERRMRRSEQHAQALYYQLDASRERAMLEAMILADEDGLCVAASGDPAICEEFAVHTALVCEDTESFAGTILAPARHPDILARATASRRWDVSMQRFDIEGVPLYLCAIGGGEAERAQEIASSMGGVSRILA